MVVMSLFFASRSSGLSSGIAGEKITSWQPSGIFLASCPFCTVIFESLRLLVVSFVFRSEPLIFFPRCFKICASEEAPIPPIPTKWMMFWLSILLDEGKFIKENFFIYFAVKASNSTNLTKFVLIMEFVLVAYLLYSLTKNVYNSYQVDKYIVTFEEDNLGLTLENQQKMDDYLYFTSDEYIDKIAKQNLGLVNRGEKVIILSEDNFGLPGDEYEDEYDFATFEDKKNPQLWLEFFFY